MLNSNLFKNIFFQSKLPQLISTVDLKCVEINHAFTTFLGYTKSELDSVTLQDFSNAEDFERDWELLQQLLNGQIAEYEMVKKYYHKNGNIKVGRLIVSMIQDEACNERYILGQVYDLTEKVEIEENVKRSEEKYRLLAENSSDMINLHEVDGTYLYVSPSIKLTLGYEADELIGKLPYEFIHPDDQKEVRDVHEMVLKDKPAIISTYRMKKKDGTFIWIESTIKSVYNKEETQTRLISVSRDIQQRIETNELLRKSEKLAVVGQMAAAVAHEIRNPLTPIKGFMQVAHAGAELNKEYTKIVLDEIERIEGIIAEFLSIAKPHSEKKEFISVDQLISQVIQLINPQAMLENKVINCINQKPIRDGIILGDSSSLKQVFINILQNALDASNEKGKIDVVISYDEQTLSIKIVDEGIGIPSERLSKIGEPFYSTKEKGTGLGLMTCYRIIEHHKGSIHFESKVGQGTSVNVTLPLSFN
ncbi:PAS domain S-box protein [Bacillus sp. PS06]|uniref:PAS domain S-box protein n=1 Tax=Bacillus sp. PS06 TaxID=2764176 RepID=UPI00177CF402|nr:PAS domain S-box protein [Bacillus sp. PS06]MBD8067876.1 PAS domain S-box protein [Bacillus sp. PS06]